jgi:hypothetical protein
MGFREQDDAHSVWAPHVPQLLDNDCGLKTF